MTVNFTKMMVNINKPIEGEGVNIQFQYNLRALKDEQVAKNLMLIRPCVPEILRINVEV